MKRTVYRAFVETDLGEHWEKPERYTDRQKAHDIAQAWAKELRGVGIWVETYGAQMRREFA